MTENKNKYDLEERTAKLGENIIKFCKTLNQDHISKPLINQLVRSATGIGANYVEANGASSKRDFCNKIFICKKESQESKHWLRMINSCFPDQKETIKILWQECQELSMIFHKIANSSR